MHKTLKLVLVTVILMTAPAAFALNADSLFREGNKLYGERNYKQALSDYLNLEKFNYVSAPLYFNIGNCYFKDGKLGYAILYYLRARHLNPNDDDIKANLAFARQFMPTTLEGVTVNPVTTFFDNLVGPYTLNGMAWFSSSMFISLMLFLSAVLYFRLRGVWVRVAGYIVLILLLTSAGLTSYKYRTDFLTSRGVIVSDTAQIYSGPGEDNDLEFTGAFGLTFTIENSVNDYYLVTFENQRKGWIKKSSVEVI